MSRKQKLKQMSSVAPLASKPVAMTPPEGISRIIYSPPPVSAVELIAETNIQSLPVETVIYKYTSQKHASSLVENGSTRIGTLWDFRNAEKHGPGILDVDEGKKRVHLGMVNQTFGEGSVGIDHLKEFGWNLQPGTTISNIYFSREINHPDVYVWCGSTVKDRSVMAELDGADACVEIIEAGAFFNALTEAISQVTPVEFLGFKQIVYFPRDEKWNQVDFGLSAAFTKEPNAYASQYEVRAIWAPLNGEAIQPFILERSDAARFANIVDVVNAE